MRVLKWFGVILLGLMVLVAIGAALAWRGVLSHLTPPDHDPGRSLSSYQQAAPSDAPSVPPLVRDFDWERLHEPPKSARAWTRWWWPGGAVEGDELVRQLAMLDEAGFGGMEVQPFIAGATQLREGPLGAALYSFDTPDYYGKLNGLLAAAEQRGMAIDLTHFSGWPPGGPEVPLDESPWMLTAGEARVDEGPVDIALPRPRPGPPQLMFQAIESAGGDFINFAVDHRELLSVVGMRVVGGRHSLNPFDLDDTVELDGSSAVLLDDRVQDGRLRWEAPPGEWQVVASYLMPSGEVPMAAAQQPQGFVVDHLRSDVVRGHYEYAFGARTGLGTHYGRGLRGFFNDSLEFRIRRMATADILDEFRSRRGYDLAPWLPAIHVEGRDDVYFREIMGIHAAPEFRTGDEDERIRDDYQRTLSDLIIERFVETSAQWARERGLISRGQSYGIDIDLIRALGANDIPETEQLWAGGRNVALKMASSAAWLYGRPLVSAESFVWINRDYTTTARKIKATADKLFLAGINHIVYHGTPYVWHGDDSEPFGEQGWYPFSGPENPAHFSSNVSPGNPALWPDVPDVNLYIARAQNLLRQGSPDIDVLIYYPWLGFAGPDSKLTSNEILVDGHLPDADPSGTPNEAPELTAARELLDSILSVPAHEDPRSAWMTRLLPMLEQLEQSGSTWAWVNDHAIQSGSIDGGRLEASQGRYRALLSVDAETMPAATVRALGRLVEQRVPVFAIGELPSRQSGFLDHEARDREVAALYRGLVAAGIRRIESSELVPTLARELDHAVDLVGSVRVHRRMLPDGGGIVFVANQSADPATAVLEIGTPGPVWQFDASSGAVRSMNAGDVLNLEAFESRFVIHGRPMPSGVPVEPALAVESEQVLAVWALSADGYSTQLDSPASLPDWRTVPELAHSSGPGRYVHRLTLQPVERGRFHRLDLGLVHGSARVRVNGRDVGRASLPPFQVDVSGFLKAGENEIEVEVTPPLRNAFVGRAVAGEEKYQFMRAFEGQLAAAGLVGPVRLVTLSSSAQ